MSKLDLITIAIVIVCLGALGYLVYKIVNLMNPPETETTAIEDSYADPVDNDTTYTDWDNEATTGGDVDLDDEDLASNITDDAAEGYEGGQYDDSELDKDTDEVAEKESTEASSSASNNDDSGSAASAYDNVSSRSNAGKYMVIAGSYKQKINAANQVSKLHKLGYNETKVELFNRGSYAVVLVDRFSNYSQAKALVSKLAGNGVEAMVKEKN